MTRYLYHLASKDLTLTKSMISLGSCTMKANPASFLIPIQFQGFSTLHPYSPLHNTKGYHTLLKNLEKWLV